MLDRGNGTSTDEDRDPEAGSAILKQHRGALHKLFPGINIVKGVSSKNWGCQK